MSNSIDLHAIEANEETPVLFLIFSRPELTREVFKAIRKARPKQLFVAADGPRPDKPGEAEKCEEARKIVNEVDWPCQVNVLFREKNLGCGRAVSGAITWFFEHVEEGIILEDDTVPGPGFFRFCSEMLERYRHDTRIMTVSGSGYPCKKWKDSGYSYFFSNWDHQCGWATWRRAWKNYDFNMNGYPQVMEHQYFEGNYYSMNMRHFIRYCYNTSYYLKERVKWWSYQWGFARKINSGLVIVPNGNMIVNIGFGDAATNISDPNRADLFTYKKIEFPLKHPEFVMVDRLKDDQVFRENFTYPGSTLKSLIKEMLPSWILKKWTSRKFRMET